MDIYSAAHIIQDQCVNKGLPPFGGASTEMGVFLGLKPPSENESPIESLAANPSLELRRGGKFRAHHAGLYTRSR